MLNFTDTEFVPKNIIFKIKAYDKLDKKKLRSSVLIFDKVTRSI